MSDSGESDNDMEKQEVLSQVDSDDDDVMFDADNPVSGIPPLPALEGTTKVADNIPSIMSAQVSGLEIGDDDDSDDEEDDESFQKFDEELKEKYLENIHPETLSHNYDEISSLSRVVRDNNGSIIDELHRTVPWLTKYERTRILGQRIKQLNTGAEPFIKVASSIIDNSIIAQMELEQKKLPFIIRRPIPGGGSEYWRLKDLSVLN
jgi:DNA-directed RNA polymerase subunit K/omega